VFSPLTMRSNKN